ncbi:MAG: PTS transporter subunit EIIC [Solobacterium sp.]|nr:PTS transporter subunit EIIC [Solobacterium sp.]
MDYKQIAQNILDAVGGADNVQDATHCMTRLRLVLRDPSKASKETVEKLEGVIQVVEAGGQFQVVLGGKVNKIYDEFLPLVNVQGGEELAITGDKGSFVNTVLQTISKIFTPIVPAIAASGLIKGLLSAASRLGWVDSAGSTYIILFAASNIIFYFIPVFLAYTTAKAMKCSEIIAMVLGAFLCYPQIDALVQDVATASNIFGLPVVKTAFTIGEQTRVFSYTESVIPIVLSVIVLSYLEKFLKKYIPEILQIILVPGLSLIIMLPVMLTVVGPVGAYIGYGMQWLYNALMSISPLLGGAVVGGLWGVFVIFGAHRALLPIGLNDVSVTSAIHNCGAGHNTLMCYAGAANFSQAGAALGVMLKTKSKELKQVAAAGSLSAFLVGITEPAIYGCNLRLKKPMVCAIIAGALGGAIMGIGGASNHGFANNGILTIATYYCSDNTLGMFLAYLIGIAVAFFGAAILTYIVGFEDDTDETLN